MKRTVLVLLLSTAAVTSVSANWPAWRGPAGNGVSAERNLPIKWGPTENIAWKLPMPQWSGATPVIWNELMFLNVAEADGDALSLWAINRATGVPLWKRPLGRGNH